MTRVEDRVATVNMFVGLSNEAAEAGLRRVLEHAPELVGLQEWGSNRHAILDRIKRRTNLDWTRPTNGGSPILWNTTRYTLLRCRGVVLARREFVGHLAARKSRLPASIATEAIYEDEVLGGQVALLDAHLTAEVQYGKGYRKDRRHRLRVSRHKRECRKLRRRERHHRRKGRRCYTVLDGNFDGLELHPLTSCWLAREGGTLGNRAVDIIFADDPAKRVQVIDTKSDHHSVVAEYAR